jgi:hypothetical protein
MGNHNGHSKMTVIWWLYRKRSEQSFPPHSEAARMPTNLASQVSGQASLTEDGLARTRAYCAVTSQGTEEDYGKLVMQSMQMGGRHMHDGMAMPGGASMPAICPGTDMKNMPMPGQAAPAATGNDHHQ